VEGLTVIFVLFGLCYSAVLILIGMAIENDLLLSPSAKKWLIVLIIVLPIIGLVIAKLKTEPLGLARKSDSSSSDNMSTTGNSYSDSGDCGGGAD